MIYLYALVDGEPSGPLGEGIAGEPLRLVPFGRLAAVLGDLEAPPRPDQETLQAQDAVARRLADRFTALLPARFGEQAPDESALAAKLETRAAEMAAALDLVRGCVQMTLRVFGEPEPVPPAEAEGGPGTRYLAARLRVVERSRSLPEIEPLREVLRPLLRAEKIRRHDSGRLLGTAYHLVPRLQTGAYLAALEGADGLLDGRRIAATGPWPPYAFAPEAAP
ncbi:MAG TPA: GvpL/GvpF family gas vesicle protein [Thermoanaerobaculia bacterium]|nr:GvpL/GvpF family gas vesicle protein [Thermoanaerobaculia bacterium]